MSMTYSSSITSKGQVLIPKAVRDELGLQIYGRVLFEVKGEEAILKRALTVDGMYGFAKTKVRLTDAQLRRAIKRSMAQGVAQKYKTKSRFS